MLRHARTLGIATAALVASAALAVALAAIGWRAEHFRDGDFIQYWLAGRALIDGVDVYDPVAWRGVHDAIGSGGYEIAPGLGFLYPLPVALYALPFAVLPLPLAGPLWFVAQGATALLTLVALGRRLFTFAPVRDLILLIVLAVVMEPVYVIGNDGNMARFLVAIAGGALVLLLFDRPFAAGLVLGLAVVKPQLFLLYVPVLVICSPARLRGRLLAGGIVMTSFSALVTLALRPSWIAEWIGQAAQARGGYGRLNAWGLLAGELPWLPPVIVLATIVAFVWWWRRARPGLAQSAAAAIGLSLFIAPYSSEYDLAALLVGVPVVLATIARFRAPWRAAIVLVLVATSPVLTVGSAIGLVDPSALFIPQLALTALVVVTQLLARSCVAAAQPWPAD